MATNRVGGPGKMDFARKFLEQDRDADETAVNQAWKDAGNEGTISRSSLDTVRRELGLTSGRRTPVKKANGKARTRPGSARPRTGSSALSNGTHPATGAETADRSSGPDVRDQVFEELEGALDRVLFRVIGIGDLPDVERLIRQCRRLVILERGPQD